MTVGELLRNARGKLRKKDGSRMTQADVAEQLGVTQSTVASWESDNPNQMTTPEVSRVVEVAALYGVDVRALLPKKKKKRAA